MGGALRRFAVARWGTGLLSLAGVALSFALWRGWCPGTGCPPPSEILGLPLSLWGCVYYTCCLCLVFAGRTVALSWLLAAGTGAHVFFLAEAEQVCAGCAATAAISFLMCAAHAFRHGTRTSVRLVGAGAAVIALALAGAVAGNSQGRVAAAVPDRKLASEEVQPRHRATDRSIVAVSPEGNPVRLDPSSRPILLVAWWCDHCDETLTLAAALPDSRRPIIVSVWDEGRPEEVHRKLSRCGLAGAAYYTSEWKPESVPLLITAAGTITGTDQICAHLAGELETREGKPR